MSGFVIAPDDPTRADVLALLQNHLEFCNTHSPREDVHALDVGGLVGPDIDFFSVRDANGPLLGVGALKRIDGTHFEIKSMHTSATARGRGVARALVRHLVNFASSRGATRISLETGSMEAFAPARALYTSAGFEPCPPFAGYRPSVSSVFMTLDLQPARPTTGAARPRARGRSTLPPR